jgi:hypothetical protein
MNDSLNDNSTKVTEILNRMFEAEMEFMRSDGSDFSGIKSAVHP